MLRNKKAMRAILRNYRQSPRKVRLVADLIRGKNVSRALVVLDTAVKRAALPIKKLLESAVSNAKHDHNVADESNLFIKEMRVDEGVTLKRIRPRARGSAYTIRKRTSNVSVVLEEQSKNQESGIKNQEKKPNKQNSK